MAFDNTNPTDLSTLKDEVTEDPISMGYASVINNTKALLLKLNDPTQNVGLDTINRPIEELTVAEVAAVIDSVEYDALSAYDKEWVNMLINRTKEDSLLIYQSKFLQLFGPSSDTRTAVLALLSKNASRVEVLFGVNTIIYRNDWIAARDS